MSRRNNLHKRTPHFYWLILIVGSIFVIPAQSQNVLLAIEDVSLDENLKKQADTQKIVSEEVFWETVQNREKLMQSFELKWDQYFATSEDGHSKIATSSKNTNDSNSDDIVEKRKVEKWQMLVDGDKVRIVKRGDTQSYVGESDENLSHTIHHKDVTTITILNGKTSKIYSLTPYSEEFSEREGAQVGEDSYENALLRPIITASWTIGTQSPSYSRKVWFDAGRNYLPIRERDGIERQYLEWNIQYIRDKESHYSLKGWTITSTWNRPEPRTSSPGEGISTVTHWLINPPLSDSTFDFPPDINVSNRTHQFHWQREMSLCLELLGLPAYFFPKIDNLVGLVLVRHDNIRSLISTIFFQ